MTQHWWDFPAPSVKELNTHAFLNQYLKPTCSKNITHFLLHYHYTTMVLYAAAALGHGLRPAVVGFVCPLVLKFLMGFRFFRDNALHQSRLFLFQLGHIAFSTEPQISHLVRMEHALRLIWRTLSPSPSSSQAQNSHLVQQSLHDLSMLSL